LLDTGERLIDASNTGGPLGHQHPDIVAAVRAAAVAPAINEGWKWPERERAAEDLIELAFDGEPWVGAVRFFLSGSEANDLALSLCQAITGRSALATRERAYHGMAGLARDVTVQPQWHGGLSNFDGGVRPAPREHRIVELPGPVGARIGDQPPLTSEIRRGALDDVAAIIIDYTQGGVYYDGSYQDAIAAEARQAGALWIADEVVTGLGRQGRWFAFQGASSRPDLVTLGKPLAGGGMPAGAVVVSQELLNEFDGQSWQTYSTYRGHPMMVAAMRAYLRVVVRDSLLERVDELDGRIEQRMRLVADQHPSVARIDGRGLHWTVELRSGESWRDWAADTWDSPIATRVADLAVEAGVLLGTSGERDSLFLAPPLIISDAELDAIFVALDHGLELADAELGSGAVARALQS
jgi:4-aminobutyrate aminotransferase-like enzyme